MILQGKGTSKNNFTDTQSLTTSLEIQTSQLDARKPKD